MIMQAQEDMVLIKGKRSKRPRPSSPGSLTVATGSSTTAESGGDDISGDSDRVITLNLSTSNPVEVDRFRDEEEEDMAKCLILLARGTPPPPPQVAAAEVYQCKTCDKSFPSFQALGGHRASHKKPIKTAEERKAARDYSKQEICDESMINLSLQIPGRNYSSKTIRVHECSICGAEFASGQALGGHMRRHRPLPAAAGSGSHGGELQESKRSRSNNLLPLDLNLPAPEDQDHDRREESDYNPFAITKERVIVFSASAALVDCHI